MKNKKQTEIYKYSKRDRELYKEMIEFQTSNMVFYLSNLGRTKEKIDEINMTNLDEIKEKGLELNIFLHGILQNYHSFLMSTIKWFEKKGTIIIPVGYNFREDLDLSSKYVKQTVDSFMQISNKSKINIIGVSYGGLVCRYYAEELNGKEFIDKLITVGTPYCPVSKNNLAYWFSKFTGGNPDIDNKYIESMKKINSVKNHLAIRLLDDLIMPIDKIECDNVREVFVRGGHHPSSHHPERLEVILKYLNEEL